MANNFPPVPVALNLKSVTYTMNFGITSLNILPSLQFEGVVTNLFGALTSLGNQGGVQFTFTNAGNTGAFDQDEVESCLESLALAVFDLVHVLTGEDITSLVQNFSIRRDWTWVDDAGNNAEFHDTMPYAPPGQAGG